MLVLGALSILDATGAPVEVDVAAWSDFFRENFEAEAQNSYRPAYVGLTQLWCGPRCERFSTRFFGTSLYKFETCAIDADGYCIVGRDATYAAAWRRHQRAVGAAKEAMRRSAAANEAGGVWRRARSDGLWAVFRLGA